MVHNGVECGGFGVIMKVWIESVWLDGYFGYFGPSGFVGWGFQWGCFSGCLMAYVVGWWS